MKKWARDLEFFIDKAIPYSLILLGIIIVIDLGFHDIAHDYHLWLVLGDYLVVLIFIIDIIFKYIRIKPFKEFLKHSWLDILVVFPFALIFRLVEGIGGVVFVTKSLKEGQTLLHEGLEVEKGVSRVLREVEVAGKVSRTSRLTKTFRVFARLPRFLKAFSFYEVPWGKHHRRNHSLKHT